MRPALARLAAACMALVALAGAAPASPTITVPPGPFVAEGLAPAQTGRGWLVGGVLTGTILQLGDGPARTVFQVTDPDLGVYNLLADPRRHVLWASAAPRPGHTAASKLLEIDWRTGRLLAEHLGPPEAKSSFGDLMLGADGSLYVSDSGDGRLLRLAPGAQALEVVSHGVFRSPQGLARAPGRALIVADYVRGLFVLGADGAVAPLPLPDGRPLTGIDGLLVDGRDLIAVQNGREPNQVLALRLDAGRRRILKVTTLAEGPPFEQPTGIALRGGRLAVVAHSQWEGVADGGAFQPGTGPAEIRLLPLP